jgi:hypothetical protein
VISALASNSSPIDQRWQVRQEGAAPAIRRGGIGLNQSQSLAILIAKPKLTCGDQAAVSPADLAWHNPTPEIEPGKA